ncbi:MAG: bifunctional riboflavin kinase/FAD synthetase [Clostridium sp.]
MKVIENRDKIQFSKNNYVALGSFDGLHLGHLSLIEKVINEAREKDGASMVYTFKNHPRTILNKENPPKLLMDNNTKEETLRSLGLDYLVFEEFTSEFMKLTPEEFVKNLVVNYNVKGIVVGFNYRFGFKNLGDITLLKELSGKYNYELFVLEPFTFKDIVVSSSRIRKELIDGDIVEVNHMLSRPYSISGIVTHGKKLGRTIGFPTANLKINENMLLPKTGVYYTNVLYDKKIYKGITNVGMNPTVNGKNISVETFILDFNEEIYEKEIRVSFLSYIRGEKKFNSLKELLSQLKLDEAFAKNQKLYVK